MSDDPVNGQSMSYQVLARKWRPMVFDEIIAQPHIVRTLKNALSAGKIHHAYLFAGPRGTGKTTTARILAKALNCENGPTAEPCGKCQQCKDIAAGSYLDVIEIDAASNTGVDDIRDLRESSHYVATGGRYKVYIIDEVHRLSGSAFDALLKTLEEPPAHVVFIFATTESHKVPATIHSRCLKFDFRLIDFTALLGALQRIADAEKISIEPAAMEIIAGKAAGSLRDGQSLLDQVSAYAPGEITAEVANEALGMVDISLLFGLVDDFAEGDAGSAIKRVTMVAQQGRDYSEFGQQLAEHLKNLLLVTTLGQETDLLDLPADRRAMCKTQAMKFTLGDLYRLVDYVREFLGRLRWSTQPLMDAQMLAVRAAKMDRTVQIETLLSRIDDLLQGTGNSSRPDNSTPARNSRSADTSAPPRPTRSQPTAPSVTAQFQPPETPPPAAGTPAGAELHGRILARIREHSSVVAGFMLNSRIVRGEAGIVDITVYQGNGFVQKHFANKSTVNMIQSEVAAEMGQGLHVRLHVNSGPPPDEAPKTGKSKPQADTEKVLESDDKLRMIVEKFDAEILPDDR